MVDILFVRVRPCGMGRGSLNSGNANALESVKPHLLLLANSPLRLSSSTFRRRLVKVIFALLRVCPVPYWRIHGSPHILKPTSVYLCVSGNAGRAGALRIKPPAASRPFGLSSLTPSRLRLCALRLQERGARLAVPFNVSHRSRRQGLRVRRTLASCGRL
jgi:hypothetical protein